MRITDDMVNTVFLIYLKYIDNSGFCIRFRCSSTLFIQWGRDSEDKATDFTVNLNIAMTVICAIPYDVSSKVNGACYLCYINSTATSLTFGANTPPFGYGLIAIGKQ